MHHFSIPFRETLIPLYQSTSKAALAQQTPSGKVPVLETGDIAIWDTLAIVEYLAENHPDLAIWPSEPNRRAIARSYCAEMHSGFAAMRADLPMDIHAREVRPALHENLQADINRIVELWLKARIDNADTGAFLFGHFSAADAFFAPVASRFRSYDIVLPALARDYVDAIFDLPSMRAWILAADEQTAQSTRPRSL